MNFRVVIDLVVIAALILGFISQVAQPLINGGTLFPVFDVRLRKLKRQIAEAQDVTIREGLQKQLDALTKSKS